MELDGGRTPADLLAAVSLGERAALAELYRRTSAKLFGVCLRILNDRQEAEEVLQEVYVAVWHKASMFDVTRASAITWLAAIARNRALDRLRAQKNRRAWQPIEDAQDISDGAPSALATMENAEDLAALHRCLDELEDPQRGAIRSAFLEGATYDELARSRNVPLGTMKSWIRRGLIRLRGCLEA
jgi:RNA polymerase sigma factor (sigma-70 family)